MRGSSNPKRVVIETALFFCHKPEVSNFLVGELAEKANAIFYARHEEVRISAKMAGLILREVGIYGHRVTEGFKIELTNAVREHVHRLARDFSVPSLDDGQLRCCYCQQDGSAA